MWLDWLEPVLSFAEVLEIPTRVVGDTEHPLGALQRVALMLDETMGRFSGVGRVRILSCCAR